MATLGGNPVPARCVTLDTMADNSTATGPARQWRTPLLVAVLVLVIIVVVAFLVHGGKNNGSGAADGEPSLAEEESLGSPDCVAPLEVVSAAALLPSSLPPRTRKVTTTTMTSTRRATRSGVRQGRAPDPSTGPLTGLGAAMVSSVTHRGQLRFRCDRPGFRDCVKTGTGGAVVELASTRHNHLAESAR